MPAANFNAAFAGAARAYWKLRRLADGLNAGYLRVQVQAVRGETKALCVSGKDGNFLKRRETPCSG